MSYRIAGIDVHKKMLAVVVSDVEIESEFQFERRMFGSNRKSLLKSVPPQRPFPPRSASLRGWVPAPATKRAPASTTATAPRTVIATCGAYSIKRPTLQRGPEEVSSRSCTVDRSSA